MRRQELTHYQAQLRSLEQFQRNFERLLKLLLQRQDRPPRRLVVFVDDLDRCLPEKAIQVLEAIKLFLDARGCVFVLGLDAEAIENAVRSRYRDEVKPREYLEKIIQVPFILPLIEDAPMREYVQSLAPALPDPRCAEVFSYGLPRNPRQVKRTLNIFLLLSRLVEHRPDLSAVVTAPRLAKFVAIQHAHPSLYELLRLRPGYLPELEAFFRQEHEREPGAEEQAMRLPEALQPFQGDETLRRLLRLFDEPDGRFDVLKPLEMRSFVTLSRQATPTAPTVVERMPFEPEMVLVPDGPFLMGTSEEQMQDMLARFEWAQKLKTAKQFDTEQPDRTLTLPAFEISRYPVTNVEYAAFVSDFSYHAPLHWPDGNLPNHLSDHPVVNVSWLDALAYVEWLRERTGSSYRLPTEAEWEKAARGNDGRLWPWGNQWDPARANCQPDGPGDTTPVGQYSPGSDSPYGCADMSGNVWEWCSSAYAGYPYQSHDKRENLESTDRRVLRGGSFYNGSDLARCACRVRIRPDTKDSYYGFRVARSSP